MIHDNTSFIRSILGVNHRIHSFTRVLQVPFRDDQILCLGTQPILYRCGFHVHRNLEDYIYLLYILYIYFYSIYYIYIFTIYTIYIYYIYYIFLSMFGSFSCFVQRMRRISEPSPGKQGHWVFVFVFYI